MGQVTQDVHKNVRPCRENIRNRKVHLKFHLPLLWKVIWRVFINTLTKRWPRKNPHPLLSMQRDTVRKGEEKTEILTAFFASIFNRKTGGPQGNRPPELLYGEQNELPIKQEGVVSNLLHHWTTHSSDGLDRICLRLLRELAEEFAKPLSILYHESWLARQVPVDWRLAIVMPIHKKGQKDPRIYRLFIQNSLPEEVMEQMIWSAIMQHIQNK